MGDLDILNGLLPKFEISSGSIGLTPTLRIQPPPEALGTDGLALSRITQTSTIVQLTHDIDLNLRDVDLNLGNFDLTSGIVDLSLGNVDVSFAGKWVRSANSDRPDPSTEDPIGGMPTAEQHVLATDLTTNLPPETLMLSDSPENKTRPGVPEILGRIKGTPGRITGTFGPLTGIHGSITGTLGSITGTFKQSVERISDSVTPSPITIAVRWRVLDESTPGVSVPASGVKYLAREPACEPSNWRDLPPELELPGEPGTRTPSPLFLRFPLMFSELTTDLMNSGGPFMKFIVQASIKLTLNPQVKTGWHSLPPVSLPVPTVPIPTILVLFEHAEFAGRKLVLVPPNSPITANKISIGAALDLASSTLRSLKPDHELINFLAATNPGTPASIAANVLKGIINEVTSQTIVAALSRIEKLSAVCFERFFGFCTFDADNKTSSIIAIGPPGNVFDFFHEEGCAEYITRLRIVLDGRLGCALVGIDPPAPPPAEIFAYGDPSLIASWRPNGRYNDQISSLQVISPPARFLPA